LPFIGVDKHNTSIAYFKQTIINAGSKENSPTGKHCPWTKAEA